MLANFPHLVRTLLQFGNEPAGVGSPDRAQEAVFSASDRPAPSLWRIVKGKSGREAATVPRFVAASGARP
jgi:hypothetical protein